MDDSVDVRVRLPVDLKKQLDALARASKRSRSELTADALQRFIEQDAAEIEHINRALEASRLPQARFVPHKQARAWIRSDHAEPVANPNDRPRRSSA